MLPPQLPDGFLRRCPQSQKPTRSVTLLTFSSDTAPFAELLKELVAGPRRDVSIYVVVINRTENISATLSLLCVELSAAFAMGLSAILGDLEQPMLFLRLPSELSLSRKPGHGVGDMDQVNVDWNTGDHDGI